MQAIKISAVSYLNAQPFIYGIQQSELSNTIEIELDTPANCAHKLLHNKVDIGLVPVAIIPHLKESFLLTDYCIGAVGAVNSVMLYGEVPLASIKKIYLDYQSKTSVALVKILAKNYWKINPQWVDAEINYENNIKENTAAVIIGDRTFELKNKFNYAYDLAEEWGKLTGLPFVFACWVSNKKLSVEFTDAFNKANKFGVDNIEKMIDEWGLNRKYTIDVKEYLTKNISYNLDAAKQEGMKFFLEYLKCSL